jgi:two-component system OmpR family response regulator
VLALSPTLYRVGDSDSLGPNAPRPLPAELHARVQETRPVGSRAVLELELSSITVPAIMPLPVGTMLTLNLRLSSTAPAVTTVARVSGIEPASVPGQPALMRLVLGDVWGKRAAEQLSQYIEEAMSFRPPPVRFFTGVRVLVVDDNQQYRERSAQVMREAGFEVITANNGIEGLSAALKHQPSVIVTDVTMPGLDGFQLLRLIRARPALSRMPVVFLTDLTSQEQRLRSYELGVDDYVQKPFTAVELIARVERVLERARANNQVANGMRGDLAKMSLASLLSFVELERRSGVLQIESEGETATLQIRDGAVMRIDLGAAGRYLEGIDRFLYVLDWTSGQFELTSTEVLAEDALEIPTSYALIEHARRSDERAERKEA